jgi:hypothetical protein
LALYTLALCSGVLLIVALWPDTSFAERPVDPNGVGPEFGEVAEKRRAEQVELFECTKRPIKPCCCAGIGLRSLVGAWAGDRPIDGR